MIVCRTTQGGLTNVLGALYATTLFFSIINATVIQPVVFAERAVSYRERAAGTYSVLPWVMALVSTTAVFPHSYHAAVPCSSHWHLSTFWQRHACGMYWRGNGPLGSRAAEPWISQAVALAGRPIDHVWASCEQSRHHQNNAACISSRT